ncbi:hypothetical protein ACWCQW_53020 [Streptomyces mirabilis]
MRYPTRLQPVITVHRDTLLNSQLGPASRLLYVTLLACADGAHINEISALAGNTANECADPYLKKLRDAGLIETGDHYGQGETITVHEIPIVPSQRSHACVPCTLCGNCSCQHPREICRICDLKREVD